MSKIPVFEVLTYWFPVRSLNHYTTEPTVNRRHRKAFSSLQSCMTDSTFNSTFSYNLIQNRKNTIRLQLNPVHTLVILSNSSNSSNWTKISSFDKKIELVSNETGLSGALRMILCHYLNGKNKDTKCLLSTSTCQNMDSLV